MAAARPAAPPAPAKTKYFYVNRPTLELKVIPLESSATTGTVKLNDRLEILSASPKGWTKVPIPATTTRAGWRPAFYLPDRRRGPAGSRPQETCQKGRQRQEKEKK